MQLENMFKVMFGAIATIIILMLVGGVLLVGCVVKKGVEVSNSEEFQQKGLKGVINKTWEGSSTNNVSE